MSPQDAILRELKSGRYDLVVMGVNRRPGEALFFGNVAGARHRERRYLTAAALELS